jgi:hypothetical protein
MKKFLSILLAAILVFSLGTVAFGLEADDESTTATTAEATTEEAKVISDLTGDTFMGNLLEAKDASDIKTAIKDSFAKVKKNIENLSINDILALPTNIMDDIVTNFFAILKALGVDVDALYEKLASNKIINWIANFYKGGALTTVKEVEKVPETGSTASLAAFATLSLAAAAAFVCYKKKEA